MQPLALPYVSHLDFLCFVRRLHATIGPAVLNATFLFSKMFRIHWRLHGTSGPAVLKSTFFGYATLPECHPQQHFSLFRGAHSLPPLFIPSFPAAFPFCSSLAPWLAPPSQWQFGWQAREFGHIRRNRFGKIGRSKTIEFSLTSALQRPNQPRRR